MISTQVCDMLKLMLGKPGINVILLPDDAQFDSLPEGEQQQDFVKFSEIRQILSIPEETAPQTEEVAQ